MNLPVPDLLASMGRATETFADALNHGLPPNQRAVTLAKALRILWPAAAGCAAAVHDVAGSHVAAFDRAGNTLPIWEAALRKAQPLPVAAHEETLCYSGRVLGKLILAADGDEARIFLAHAAPLAAMHLVAADLRYDLVVESARADVGELAGPLMHDVANAFNNLQLNLMVLEQGAGDLSSINFGRLRTRMDQVMTLVREVQEYRRTSLPAGLPTDINAAAQEAMTLLERDHAELMDGTFAIEFEPGQNVPPVFGARTDVVRCLLLLLKNGAKIARAAGKPLHLRTRSENGVAVIGFAVPGLLVPVESALRLYDTLETVCPVISSLELATAKSIARRFNGRPSADCPAEGLSLRLTTAIA